MCSAMTWPFLQNNLDMAEDTRAIWDYEDYFAQIADRDQRLRRHQHVAPQSFGRERYVLHAFSGRRRFGDFQHFFDAILEKQEGTLIHILSVDVILDPILGNLMDVASQEHWYAVMWQRYIIAFLGGPPCNTWSAVRHQALPGGAATSGSKHEGPRPVREPNSPWGKVSLRLRELDYVEAGNSLLGFSITSLYIMMMQDGCGGLEHPGDPNPGSTTEKVTIWRLPVIAALLQCPGVCLHEVLQGYHGSEAPKPTGVLTVNISNLPSHLRKWRITTTLPRSCTTGKDQTGAFNTAKLKEYAPSFCAGLAHAFHEAIAAVPVDSTHHVSDEFKQKAVQMVSTQRGRTIGLDHHAG